MDQFNIYQVETENGYERHLASFTDETRANEMLDRLRARDAEDTAVDYNMRPAPVDPSSDELNLPQNLGELVSASLSIAALREIQATGHVMMPLWINANWLMYELGQKGLVLKRSGRMLMVDDGEAAPLLVTTEAEDLREAWTSAANEVMTDDDGFRESW